jgi:ABC-2 type transport system ATP-binding protein
MIEATGIVKRYASATALDGVDLEVPTGSVYGLVGPNGAGKTTLLGILAGLRHPTSGNILIDADRSEIAVLPDTPRFDPWLTGREAVALSQHLTDPDGDGDRIESILTEAGLEDAMDRTVAGYSRGMLQRLGVACTLVATPRLVLLDEPASALDPLGRREVLDLIGRMRGEATVLFSSHILADVQEVCDTVGILDHGKLLFQGAIDELLVGAAVPRYVVRCRPPVDGISEALVRQPWVNRVEVVAGDELRIDIESLEDAERLLPGVLAETGARVVSFGPEAVTLEQAFLAVTG